MFWILTGLLAAFSSATKDYVSKHTMKNSNHYLTTWALMTLSVPFLLVALFFVGIPQIGAIFWPVALFSSVLYVISVSLYMKAISMSPLSLTLPMLSFTPIFMLITGPILLGEFPEPLGILGIVCIVSGAYVLNIKEARRGILQPFVSLLKEKGPVLMLLVSLMWSVFSTLMKNLILESNMILAVASVYSISAVMFSIFVIMTKRFGLKEIRKNFRNLTSIGFFMALSEISLSYTYTMTLAVYAIAVKRTSILMGSIYGFKFFKEGNVTQRLAGSVLMILGIVLIAL